MGKKITVEIKYWEESNDFLGKELIHTAEARYVKGDSDMTEEGFVNSVNEQAYSMLVDVSTKGFIGYDADKNQFFVIKPQSVISATATVSDTIDTK